MSKSNFRQKTRVLTGREARRYGERERTREQRKADADRFWALTPEERAQRIADNAAFQRIQQNGITLDDLKNAEEQGYKNGRDAGVEGAIKTCYAAICLALNELHGFDSDQCMEVLNAVDGKVVMALTSQEAIDEVYQKMGLEINFKAGPCEDRIQEVGA